MILEASVFVHLVYPGVVGWIIRLYTESQDDVFAVSILAHVAEQRVPVTLALLALHDEEAVKVDHRPICTEHSLELSKNCLMIPRHEKCHGVDGFNLPEDVRLFHASSWILFSSASRIREASVSAMTP